MNLKKRIAVNESRSAICRITEETRVQLESLIFRRYPAREWGTIIRFGYRINDNVLGLTIADLLPPSSGDLDPRSGIVEFRPSYLVKAISELENSALGIGVVHSHPEGCGLKPSLLDDDMDEYFSELSKTYGNGRPYISLIFGRDSNGESHFSGRIWSNGEWFSIKYLFTVGQKLRREISSIMPNAASVRDAGTTARLDSLYGERAALRLSNSTVGIIGCGGTGSAVAEVLARAGIGRFVIIDYQRLSQSNLERLHGSTYADTLTEPPQYKVLLVKNHILEINPKAHVIGLIGNLLDEQALDSLLTCDLVLGCSDSQHARVAMSDFATHYLIPAIDMGVQMDGRLGLLCGQTAEIAKYSPMHPCAFCRGRVDESQLQIELMSDCEKEERRNAAIAAVERGEDPDPYWKGEPPQLLTVGYWTTAVGAIAAGYAIGWLTGAFSTPHDRFQFDMGLPLFNVSPIDDEFDARCHCSKRVGWADQARADRSLGRPEHWPTPILVS